MATSGRPARHCAAAPPAPCATDEKAPLLPRALAPPKGGGGGLPVADSCGAAPAGRAARAVLVGLLHIVCSAGLILFNKYVLSPERLPGRWQEQWGSRRGELDLDLHPCLPCLALRFPFAVCLTTLHMFAAFVLSFLLHKVAPQLFPSADSVFGTGSEWLGRLGGLAFFLPIGACCAVSVVCANSAYNYASVSFLQMVKESVVLWVYLLGVLAGLEPLRMQCLAVLAFVTCSAALAVCSGGGFRWPGLLLQFASSFTQALQAVLMNRLMTHYHGPKVDPLSLVLGTAPVVLCLLLPVSFSLWDAEVHARLASWWRLLLLNASAAFALQVVNAVTIRELSATGLALAAVLKDLAIVASAAAVLHESLARLQVLGFLGAVGGIALYSLMKLRAAAPKAAAGAGGDAARHPA